jgi:hypothetical protein
MSGSALGLLLDALNASDDCVATEVGIGDLGRGAHQPHHCLSR